MQVKLPDLHCSFDDAGSGAPALILLHGFPLNRRIWSAQVKALSARHRVVAPDFRGHGETPATPEISTPDRLAGDVALLADHLGIRQAVIGGLSMGGYAALAFWRRFPARVKGLVLVDTRSDADTPEGKQNRYRMIRLAEEKGPAAVAAEMLPKVLGRTTLETRADVVSDIETMMSATPLEGIRMALFGLAARPDATPDLPKIACPTLIAVGEEDTITPVELSRAMAGRIPSARLAVIPAAGHLPCVENPEPLTREIASFLSEISP